MHSASMPRLASASFLRFVTCFCSLATFFVSALNCFAVGPLERRPPGAAATYIAPAIAATARSVRNRVIETPPWLACGCDLWSGAHAAGEPPGELHLRRLERGSARLEAGERERDLVAAAPERQDVDLDRHAGRARVDLEDRSKGLGQGSHAREGDTAERDECAARAEGLLQAPAQARHHLRCEHGAPPVAPHHVRRPQ